MHNKDCIIRFTKMLYEAVSLYKECIYKSLKIKFGNYELYKNVIQSRKFVTSFLKQRKAKEIRLFTKKKLKALLLRENEFTAKYMHVFGMIN